MRVILKQMRVEDGQLSDFLLTSGALSRRSLDEALGEHDGSGEFGEALVARGYITDDDLRRAIAGVLGLPFIALRREDIDPTALVLIPEPLARAHNMLAFRITGDYLDVALLKPEAVQVLGTLSLPYRIVPHVTTEHSIKHGLLYYQKLLKEHFSKVVEQSGHAVEAFLHHAVLSHAQGIHIDINTAGAIVRYRLNHVLQEAMRLPVHMGVALSERLKALAKLMPTSRTLQEGRFKFEKDGERHMVHVASLPTHGGERLTLRLMREHEGRSGFALSSLGLHGEGLERVHAMVQQQSGLVLVAGLEGSGKTTALYTLLDQVDHWTRSVATVEQSIAHPIPHVAQTLIRPQLGLGPAETLRSVLRTHPEVLMVDSITDPETASMAIRAANLGTFVLAGIEAPSAGGAIEKLRSFGVPNQLIAATLNGVVAVEVAGRLCPQEREDYKLSRAESAPLEPFANFASVLGALKEEGIVEQERQWKELLFPRATQCAQCEEGYIGVAGVQEVLPITRTLKDLILQNAPLGAIEAAARDEGVLSIVEDSLFKAATGITSIEEVFRLASRRQ